MVAYELFYIVGAVNENIMSYVFDFKLERELEKMLDKLTLKISRRIDGNANFSGFDGNIELLLKFNSIGIFRGRIKTSNKKEFYTIEAYSSAEILSRLVSQKIYENTTPEGIFSNLISVYSDLTPSTAVSGTTIERFVADEYISSIISKLAEVLGWCISTDASKIIYFQPRGNVTNSTIIYRQTNNCNAKFGEWKKDYNEMCNDIRVTGDTINYETQETFTDSMSKEYVVKEQPIDVKILIDGIEQILGSYTVKPEIKKIILNTPPSSSSTILIDYTYAYPIYAGRENAASITSYGRFTKIFFHKWLKTRSDVITYCNNYISTYKDPLLSNTILMNASYITSFNPGEKVRIIDDVESYDDYYIINKIKLEYLTGAVELNVGSYIPIFSNIQGVLQDRIKELEKDLSKVNIQVYNNQLETLTSTETLTEGNINYINFKVNTTYRPRCNYGRGTLYDARVGLCQS